MPHLQAAISVTEAIETYGAYAGLAAVVGLGVLSLLYFAQAREVKRLREWAAGSEEREADLTRRITAQASRAAAAARPMAQTAAGQAKKGPAKVGGPPATVAAAAAVAKAAVPAGAQVAPAASAAAAGATAAPPAAGQTVAAPVVPAKPAAQPAVGAPNGQAPMAKPAEIPVKPDAGAPVGDGQNTDTGPIAPVRTTAPRPGRPAGATLPPRTPAVPPPAAQRLTEGESSGRSPLKLIGMVVGALLVVGAVVVGVTQLGGGEDPPTPANTTATAPASSGSASADDEPTSTSKASSGSSSSTAANDPGSVNVAVLNGTTVAGLAAQIAQKIGSAGYARGTVTNGPDQSRSATIVSYSPDHKADALQVAKQIGVGEDAVQPLSQSDAVTAGEDADVVVVVGADRTDLP